MRPILLVVCLALAACTSSLPSVEEWTAGVWDDALEAVPSPREASPAVCERALPELREVGARMLPAPDPAIADAAEAWLAAAESLVFECSAEDTHQDYGDAHAELERLRSEVEVLLATGS
jgi:hypothetical protein